MSLGLPSPQPSYPPGPAIFKDHKSSNTQNPQNLATIDECMFVYVEKHETDEKLLIKSSFIITSLSYRLYYAIKYNSRENSGYISSPNSITPSQTAPIHSATEQGPVRETPPYLPSVAQNSNRPHHGDGSDMFRLHQFSIHKNRRSSSK